MSHFKARCIIVLIMAISLTACATLPKDIPKVPSYAVENHGDTRIARAVAQLADMHPGLSGFYMLPSDMDAFIARAILIEGAERSLDLQYYIVSDDLTVSFLMERLISAADRGVRVRLLFDYLGTGLKDSQLWMLSSHPNIEVRLFNPKGSLRQLNHRMHNKAFIVDNVVGIVGGRNMADEYFGAREDVNFADMDLMTAGPIVKDVSKSFDIYWNSEWAIPFKSLSSSKPDEEDLKKAFESLKEKNKNAKDSKYAVRLKESDFLSRIVKGNIPYSWANGSVVYDLPEKISENNKKAANVDLMSQLLPLASDTKTELILISPYFVPGQSGIGIIEMFRKSGMRVRIATNSLASTDVISVHSGYAKYRKELLENGVELYEMRADPEEKGKEARRKALGSYRGSLHAKIYIFDRKAVFIGSRNLDARSRQINTEIGIFVQSPEIASQAAMIFELTTIPLYCFKLGLTDDSRLVWTTVENGKEVKYYHEPMTSFWRRFSAGFISIFVPESQL
jgi:cardiolipin synthase C